MSARTGVAGAPAETSTACPAGLTSCSAAGLVPARPGVGMGAGAAGVICGNGPAGCFLRLRADRRVIISRKATTRPMSARTGVAGALVTTSTACPAGLTPCSATGLVPTGPGLGVGAGVISGKSPAAFPAPTRVVLRLDPGKAAAWMPKGLTAFPGPMSELVALFRFGSGPGGEGLADGPGEAELVVPGLAVAEPEPVELAVGVGLEDAEGVGLEEAEDVGLAVGEGDVEGVELALGVGAGDVGAGDVGAGDVERVGLGVDVDGGDVEGAGLLLVVGAGVDGDGLGVSEELGPGLVLAAAGEGEGEESTALANAGSCPPADSPMTSKPPVTRPATTARPCVIDM
jgi:hypothetical protein